jgi:hypothetical protein
MQKYNLAFSFALDKVGKKGFLVNIARGVGLTNSFDGSLVTLLFHNQSINSVNVDMRFSYTVNGKDI